MVLALVVAAVPFAAAGWGDHVATAASYEDIVTADFNLYGAPSTIWWDGAGELHVRAQCGGYASLVLRNTYPSVTATVIERLTGNAAPSAKSWNDAIEAGASYTSGRRTWSLGQRTSVDEIVPGDLLAAEYTLGDASGHVMIVGAISLDSLSVPTAVPGHPTAERWRVEVHDATASPHGTTDSRYHAESSGANDEGIGHGPMYLYADQATGAIVGWTWSTSSSTTSYQGTSPAAEAYRPMVAGYLSGPGL